MNCFLDLDGCIVDFIGGFCKVIGVTRESLYDVWLPGNWNFPAELGFSESDIWGMIDKGGAEFWSELEWTSDGKEILQLCEQHFDNIVLMTSPPLNPLSSAGKVEWIRQHLPKYKRKFAITPCKEEFAHADAVLIDDSDDNCNKFRHAGGKTVLVPRRWNTGCWMEQSSMLSALEIWLSETAEVK